MALSDSEIESLRYHLGYGNLDGVGANSYSPDGFKELFDQVVAPNLTGSTETTATTSITAGATTEVTPVSMTGIVSKARLVIDVGDALEIVSVRSVTASTFTATFALDHPSSGYVVALMGGHARLRLLLERADRAWDAVQSSDIGDVAGLKRIEGDVEWFPGGNTLKEREKAYEAVQEQLSRLVRVPINDASEYCGQLEAY